MATLAITNTFVAGATADASQVNTNFSDVSTWLNNRYNGNDTWLNLLVSGTAANPMECKSSNTVSEFDIDCTGSSGTPIMSFRRSGTRYFTCGVDGADSNIFKFGTTGITTNIAFQVPSTGAQVQFPTASAAAPSISFIGSGTKGFYGNSDGIGLSIGGSQVGEIAASGLQMAAGSASAPSFSFFNDSNTGIYDVSGDTLGISTAGTLRWTWDSTGNAVIGTGAIATNATDGFLYVDSCAGTPTGVPTTNTGRIPIVIDSSGLKFYAYVGGAWKGATLS